MNLVLCIALQLDNNVVCCDQGLLYMLGVFFELVEDVAQVGGEATVLSGSGCTVLVPALRLHGQVGMFQHACALFAVPLMLWVTLPG
jgi:hypothetical protein